MSAILAAAVPGETDVSLGSLTVTANPTALSYSAAGQTCDSVTTVEINVSGGTGPYVVFAARDSGYSPAQVLTQTDKDHTGDLMTFRFEIFTPGTQVTTFKAQASDLGGSGKTGEVYFNVTCTRTV